MNAWKYWLGGLGMLGALSLAPLLKAQEAPLPKEDALFVEKIECDGLPQAFCTEFLRNLSFEAGRWVSQDELALLPYKLEESGYVRQAEMKLQRLPPLRHVALLLRWKEVPAAQHLLEIIRTQDEEQEILTQYNYRFYYAGSLRLPHQFYLQLVNTDHAPLNPDQTLCTRSDRFCSNTSAQVKEDYRLHLVYTTPALTWRNRNWIFGGAYRFSSISFRNALFSFRNTLRIASHSVTEEALKLETEVINDNNRSHYREHEYFAFVGTPISREQTLYFFLFSENVFFHIQQRQTLTLTEQELSESRGVERKYLYQQAWLGGKYVYTTRSSGFLPVPGTQLETTWLARMWATQQSEDSLGNQEKNNDVRSESFLRLQSLSLLHYQNLAKITPDWLGSLSFSLQENQLSAGSFGQTSEIRSSLPVQREDLNPDAVLLTVRRLNYVAQMQVGLARLFKLETTLMAGEILFSKEYSQEEHHLTWNDLKPGPGTFQTVLKSQWDHWHVRLALTYQRK